MKGFMEITNGKLVLYTGGDENVIIPDNVTKIGKNAFSYFNKVKSVTMGESVKEISDYAFYECTDLEEIILSNNIEKVGKSVFDECDKLKFNIYDNCKYLGSKTNPYLLLVKALNRDILSCSIHSDTKIIYEFAFSNCNKLEKVVIPNSVKSMGECVFANCRELKSVVFADDIKILKNETFINCFNLIDVTLPKNLKTIEHNAFKNCTKLNNIILPSSLKKIDNYAFKSCGNLKSLVLPNNIDVIGENVFLDCKDLELIYYGTKKLDVFSDNDISSVFAPNVSLKDCKRTRQKFINGYVNNFKSYENPNIDILKEYIKYIKTNKSRYFEMCEENYCNFMIINNILTIDDIDYLIEKTTEKNQVELTAALLEYKNINFTFEEIEKQFEKTLFSEKKITLSSLKPLWEIQKLDNGNYEILGYKGSDSVIEFPSKIANGYVEKVSLNGKVSGITQSSAKNIKNIIIPDTVKIVDDRAFDNCINLKSINFSSSIKKLGNYAFGYRKNLNFNIYDNAKYLGSDSNPYFILFEAIDKNITSCDINSDTKFIYDSAFDGCEFLKEIVIPDNVVSIGTNAFYGCLNLKNVELGSNLEIIKHKAFGDCSSLKKIVIPERITEISSFAFSNSSKLECVILHNNITKLGEYSFKGCSSLKSIDIPSSVTMIGSYAFEECKKLTNLRIPSEIKAINMGVFKDCISLERVEFSENLKNIKIDAFYGCKSLTNLVIPSSVTEIGANAFYNCYSLKTIVFTNNTTKIGYFAFNNCNSLSEVFYKGTVKEFFKILIGVDNKHFLNAKKYYYSEEYPFEKDKFWHYDNNGQIQIWE